MAITEDQLKADIVGSFTDDLDGYVATNIGVWWEMYAGKARSNAPLLQYWYVLRHAVERVITKKAPLAVDFSSKSRAIKLHQEMDTLADLLRLCGESIASIEKRARGMRSPASGTLTTVTPISTDDDPRTAGGLDASDRPYRGDALIRGRVP